MTTPKKGPAKKLELVLRAGPRAQRSAALGADDPRDRREAQKSSRPEVERLLEYSERDQDILRNKLLPSVLVPVTIEIGNLTGGDPTEVVAAIAADDTDFLEAWVASINTNFTILVEALAASQDTIAELVLTMQDEELMEPDTGELEA